MSKTTKLVSGPFCHDCSDLTAVELLRNEVVMPGMWTRSFHVAKVAAAKFHIEEVTIGPDALQLKPALQADRLAFAAGTPRQL